MILFLQSNWRTFFKNGKLQSLKHKDLEVFNITPILYFIISFSRMSLYKLKFKLNLNDEDKSHEVGQQYSWINIPCGGSLSGDKNL